MLSRLPFASCYVYSPAGCCPESRLSRNLRSLLKAGDSAYLYAYAARIRVEADRQSRFAEFFAGRPLLMPVPSCRPGCAHPSEFVAALAAALSAEGLGSACWSGLRRIRGVAKSATSKPGLRPTTAQHYESFAVDHQSKVPERILLVDDIITKGRTLLAAATRIHEVFPHADIRAFALLRTMGYAPEIDRLLCPCVGEIRWRRGDAHRYP